MEYHLHFVPGKTHALLMVFNEAAFPVLMQLTPIAELAHLIAQVRRALDFRASPAETAEAEIFL